MSENSWVLRGVDEETRRLAVAEAERRGVSVSDFLTEVLLSGAGEPATEAPAEEPPEEPEFIAHHPGPRENFAFRHRLEALERRLGLSTGGLESAVHALDSSLLALSARLDQTEALAGDTAETLHQSVAELSQAAAALRRRLGELEEAADTLVEGQQDARTEFTARCETIDARLQTIDAIARGADAKSHALGAAQDALQRAVAQDFNEFAEDALTRIDGGVDEMRVIADAAARHADEAVARALGALRESREAFEQGLADHADETRARMHAAFADAAERLGALAERVIENERAVTRASEQLHTRVSDVEDGVHTAIEETAEALRGVDAALAADIIRAGADTHAAIDALATSLREADDDLAARLARADEHHREALTELSERQLGGLARIKLIDASLADVLVQVSALRGTVESGVAQAGEGARAEIARHEADWEARFSALAARAGDSERNLNTAAHALSADIARVEACTFAALEKLAADITAGDAALEENVADLRAQTAGALARLRLIDQAIGEAGESSGGLAARLAQLESAVQNTETAQALAALRGDVSALAEELAGHAAAVESVAALRAQVTALAAARAEDEALGGKVDDLRARLAAQETQSAENADRMHGMARMLGRLTAQNADAATQAESRLHKLELALADVRLANYAAPEDGAQTQAALEEVAGRIVDLEERQAEAFETLRAGIAEFIGENERRLAALEAGGVATLTGDEVLIAHAVESRLTALEQRDVAAEFDTLRQRIEERVLGVEARSVRAMEQVGETVALLERRFTAGDPEREARSA